ncbi:MAG: hypothetical protein J1E80_01530 [Desulfovibrionaceae bacterium]|nr:hypothetical protein [Desulfovibrionaceae bacterium]
MGKILQIRVTAWTYDEDEVNRAWPRLTSLVWARRAAWAPAGAGHGVLELARALPDAARFGDWPESTRQAIRDGMDTAYRLSVRLEEALADWQPSLANRLSDELEDALTSLEERMPEQSGV